jgi:hypothetical protein
MRDSIVPANGTRKIPRIVKLPNRANPINEQYAALTNPLDFLIGQRSTSRTRARIALPFAPKTIPLGSSATRKSRSGTQRGVSQRVSLWVAESKPTHSGKRACTLVALIWFYCKTNPLICCREDRSLHLQCNPITDQHVRCWRARSRQPLQRVLQRKLLCRGSIGAIMLKIGGRVARLRVARCSGLQHKGDS